MLTHYSLRRRLIPAVAYHQNRYGELIADVVKPGCRWLDIGAGSRLHYGWECVAPEELTSLPRLLVGVDLQIESLQRNLHIEFAVVADTTALPFRAATFDVASANMVIEHLPNPESAFTEVGRTLVPNGQFVLVTPNKRNPVVFLASSVLKPRWRAFLGKVVEGRPEEAIFDTHYRANTLRRLIQLAADADLSAQELEQVFSWPFFRRPLVVVALECLWIRMASGLGWRMFGNNLIGRLVKLD